MTGPKRVSERQLAANRANALRSTGPRTPEGQAASARNALKHRILSKAVIPPILRLLESRAEYDALLASFVESLEPEGAVEEMLVERIASSYWRLGRVLRAEAARIAHRRFHLDHTIRESRSRGLKDAQDLRQWLSELPDDPDARIALEVYLEAEVRPDPDDEELIAAAHKAIAELETPYDDDASSGESTGQVAASLPEAQDLLLFMRYEAALDRQIHRALGALERLQRLRSGEFVPPAVRVEVAG